MYGTFFGDFPSFPGFPELVGTLNVIPTLDFLTILAVVLFHEAKKKCASGFKIGMVGWKILFCY